MDHQFAWLANGQTLFSDAASLLLSSNLRAAALLIACFFLLRFVSRSASYRHLLISSILTGILLLPLLTSVIPAVDVIVEVTLSDLSTIPTQVQASASPPGSVEQAWDASDWLSCAVMLYALGLCLNLVRQGWSIALIALVSWAARPVRQTAWHMGLENARKKLAISRSIDLRYSRVISSPATWGFWRPVILLPRAAADWPEGLINSCLLHEAAHIRRYDWLSQQLARLTCAFYWVNPLCWRALRRMEDSAESACDDLVLNAGVEGTVYASDLIHVAKQSGSPRCGAAAALAMSLGREPSQLTRRVKAILDPLGPQPASHPLTAACTLGLVLFVAVPLASLRTNTVEVPVVSSHNLARMTSANSPRATPTERTVKGEEADVPVAQFDRDALKQAAVMELRSTLAKINASSRDWLAQQSLEKQTREEKDGPDRRIASASPSGDLPTGAAATKPSEDESGAEKESQVAGQESARPTAEQKVQLNPLVAYLHELREQKRKLRYVQTRRVKPKYPRRALERGIEGEVVVSFSIDPAGRVTNPQIIEASPAGVFEGQVLRAMEQFQYQTSIVDGRPSKVEGATEVFRFVLKS